MDDTNYWNRLSRRRLLRTGAVAGLGAGALAIIGCGDDDDDDDDTGGTPSGTGTATGIATGTTTATATATATPKQGGVYRWADNDVAAWDIYNVNNTTLANISSLVRDGLLEVPQEPGTQAWDSTINAGLAADWEQPDDLTYTFKLDPRARFQNVAPLDGRAYTAQDAVYTFEYMLSKTTWGSAGYFSRIGGVEALDDATLKITMSAPYAPQLTYIASHWLMMLAPELDGKQDQPEGMSAGTGPFIFESYQPGVGTKLKANPDYWRGAPYLEGAEHVVMVDPNAKISNFKNGQLSELSGVDRTVLVSIPENEGTAHSWPSVFSFTLRTRTDMEPFNRKEVRQAISMAIDRETWLEAFWGGKGNLGDEALAGLALLPTQAPFALKRSDLSPDLLKNISYHPDEAKAMMEAAGVSGLKADLSTYNLANHPAQAQAMVPILQSIGIEPTLNVIDRGQFIATTFIGQYQGISMYGSITPFDADEWYITLRSGLVRNDAHVNDPVVDDLIEKQRVQLDIEERTATWAELQRYLVDQCYYVNGPVGDTVVMVAPNIRNYVDMPFYFRRWLRHAWMA